MIRGCFPSLREQLNELSDHRKRRDYEIAELVVGAIAMFLFREASRNALNMDRREEIFRNNYYKMFRMRLSHMDTTEDVLRRMPPEELDKLKATLVKELIEKKMFHKFKLLGKYYMIAIDGTGTNTFDKDDINGSRLHKTSKNGVITYYQYVLEAKLITGNKMAISMASEWVCNDATEQQGANFNKQDCEQKAFVRLAVKLKKYFPRLPICILADGLYPNQTFMKACQDNGWEYVVVFKDSSLKKLQEEIKDTENKKKRSLEYSHLSDNGLTLTQRKYEWITEALTYSGFNLNWLSCIETITKYDKDKIILSVSVPARFVTLTSLKVDQTNVRAIAQGGRFRWKIENEGFNIQKNQGYNLEHKYSRNSFECYKNYYQCLQIAHMINQLAEHSQDTTEFVKRNKLTIKHLHKNLICMIKTSCIKNEDIKHPAHFQIRLAG